MPKKYLKVEKVLIATSDKNYITYRCEEHGVFQQRKDVATGCCMRCKKSYQPLNIVELREKFRKELGL